MSVVLAGCGGDDKGSDSGSEGGSQAPAGTEVQGQDAQAKADARNLSTYLEACYADSQDYANCDTAEELGDSGVTIGAGPGQVEVLGASASGYRIVAHSASGNTYEIARTDQGTERSCQASIETPSCTGGTW